MSEEDRRSGQVLYSCTDSMCAAAKSVASDTKVMRKLSAPTEEPEEEDADPAENYGGTPVDAMQLSALVGAPRLGV